MTRTPFKTGFPCTGGCGCFTDRLIEDVAAPGKQRALCVWCEDGEDCPNKPSPAADLPRPEPIPKKPRRGKTAAQADLQTAARLAHLEARPQQFKETRQHTMLPTTPCKAPDCGKPTRSKVGFCGKHFYMSKLKGAPAARTKPAGKPRAGAARELLEARGSKTVPPTNGHATNGHSRVRIELTEDELNSFILRMPLQQKIRMIDFFIRPTSSGSEIVA